MKRLIQLAALVITIACTASDENTSESLLIKQSKQFSISRASLASAGYSWSVAPSGIDAEHVRLISNVYQTKQNGLIGAPGTQTFLFKALAPGTSKIILEYKRPWEKKIVRTHTITLTIEPKKKRLRK